MSRHLKIARELIAYQTDGFAVQMVNAFKELYKAGSLTQSQDSKALATIVALCKSRFGLMIDFRVDNQDPPYCLPYLANTSHALTVFKKPETTVKSWKSFSDILKDKNTFKGAIDLKNAKVSGDFTRLAMPIHMGMEISKELFSPEEAAAVFLHEVGHCFYALEFMFRSYRASQLLAGLHQVKTGRDTSMTYIYAVTAAANDLVKEGFINDAKDLVALTEIDNATAQCSVVFSLITAKLADDFGSHGASAANYEVLADDFVVRFGLGKELALALYKLSNAGIAPTGFVSTLKSMTGLAITFFYAVALGVYLTTLAMTAMLAVVLPVVIVLSMRSSGNAYIMGGVYKNDFRRIEQIREGMIGNLKLKGLSYEARDALIQDIATIGEMLKGKQAVEDIYTKVADFLFKERRSVKAALKIEADIERLTNNNLFVSASALQTA